MAFQPAKQLDDVDWRLLEELQADGRVSFTELGRRVAMSAPAVAERVRRLEEAGVIRGYRAEVDLEQLGLPIMAVIRLRTSVTDRGSFEREVAELTQVLESIRVTGEDCYVNKVAAGSISELQEAIDVIAAYGETTTSVVVGQPLRHRVLRQADLHLEELDDAESA